jgi:hypothetical protein
MLAVQSIAQSGGRWIVVSVKILEQILNNGVAAESPLGAEECRAGREPWVSRLIRASPERGGRSDDALQRVLSPLPGLIRAKMPIPPGSRPGLISNRASGVSVGDSFPAKKNLHPSTPPCAFRKLNEKKNEHFVKHSSLRRSDAGGNARNAIILSSSSTESLGCAPASAVQPRGSLDCAPWAECGERNRWDWTERESSPPRFRYAIFGLSGTGEGRDEDS